MKNGTKNIVSASVFAALVFVLTFVVKIPSVNGYINIGDAAVVLSGWFLPPLYAFLSSAIGSFLADIISGYALYAPATFIIKGVMAVLAYFVFEAISKITPKLFARIISGAVCEGFMSLGYYIFEGFLFGFIPALSSMPGNMIQGLSSLLIAVILVTVLEKSKIVK